MKTKITQLLNITHPFIQGGMAWIANPRLASSVSNAGGLGLLGTGSADADQVRKQIRDTKELTDKPFGINIMLMNPHADDIAQVCIDEKIAVVTTGAGMPSKYIPAWKQAGIKVIPVVPNVSLAKRVERYGADAVVAEGCEAGGHIGETTTMCLIPQIVDAVNIPVIAAGGIADARGVGAAFILGASAVQMGTIFLCTNECEIHGEYKKLIVSAKDTGTAVTGRNTGHPVRCVKNIFTKTLSQMEKENADPMEFEKLTLGSYKKAFVDGNTKEGTFMAGQIAGMINEIKPVKQVID
ncbi:MAG: enoyl-[acyl-carrier-protein] reductase FabK, partial [Oscillospiraceae bacterium]